jgi:hypothetical protein
MKIRNLFTKEINRVYATYEDKYGKCFLIKIDNTSLNANEVLTIGTEVKQSNLTEIRTGKIKILKNFDNDLKYKWVSDLKKYKLLCKCYEE